MRSLFWFVLAVPTIAAVVVIGAELVFQSEPALTPKPRIQEARAEPLPPRSAKLARLRDVRGALSQAARHALAETRPVGAPEEALAGEEERLLREYEEQNVTAREERLRELDLRFSQGLNDTAMTERIMKEVSSSLAEAGVDESVLSGVRCTDTLCRAELSLPVADAGRLLTVGSVGVVALDMQRQGDSGLGLVAYLDPASRYE